MSIFNYGGLTFQEHKGENYHVLALTFLNYNGDFKEITITWNCIGRKAIWVAEFSGLSTEYSGNLTDVLDSVVKHYDSEKWKIKEASV